MRIAPVQYLSHGARRRGHVVARLNPAARWKTSPSPARRPTQPCRLGAAAPGRSAPGCPRDDQSHPRTGGGAAVRPGPSTKIPSAVSSCALTSVLVAFAAATAQHRVSLSSSFLSWSVCVWHTAPLASVHTVHAVSVSRRTGGFLSLAIILERATHHAPHHTGEPANRHQQLLPRVTPSSLTIKKPERSSQAAARERQPQKPTSAPTDGDGVDRGPWQAERCARRTRTGRGTRRRERRGIVLL